MMSSRSFCVEVGVDRRAREVARVHLLREPLDLPARVDEDHRLRDRQRLVQVAQRVELPLLPLDHHVELLDAVERELVALDEDADRVAHELRVSSSTSAGMVAEKRPTCTDGGSFWKTS